MKKKIVVLTGAGISAESGLKTFRDADGLWEGHEVMDVASPLGFRRNPSLVLDFYNQRRKQLLKVNPNKAHEALVHLETSYDVTVITQNVDDLHERAGSSKVVHLHGELLKVRCTRHADLILDWKIDLLLGDRSPEGHQLRPYIVWFGEEVPLLEKAIKITALADILLIVGTSMQVYPAASLIEFVNPGTPIYFVDPRPTINPKAFQNLTILPKPAATGVPVLVATLMDAKS